MAKKPKMPTVTKPFVFDCRITVLAKDKEDALAKMQGLQFETGDGSSLELLFKAGVTITRATLMRKKRS